VTSFSVVLSMKLNPCRAQEESLYYPVSCTRDGHLGFYRRVRKRSSKQKSKSLTSL
jgi:hypothetical protein